MSKEKFFAAAALAGVMGAGMESAQAAPKQSHEDAKHHQRYEAQGTKGGAEWAAKNATALQEVDWETQNVGEIKQGPYTIKYRTEGKDLKVDVTRDGQKDTYLLAFTEKVDAQGRLVRTYHAVPDPGLMRM